MNQIDSEAARLPGTTPLSLEGDAAAQMIAGIHRYLDRELDAADSAALEALQNPAAAGDSADALLGEKRQELARYIGVIDERKPVPALEFVCSTADPFRIAATRTYDIHAMRWPVLEGVDGEGLLLRPKQPPIAHVIALPDADWTPEMLAGLAPGLAPEQQFARRLVEQGCQVVVPALIDRSHAHSGNPAIRMTDQPHREYIYRMACEMGRHVIGYEVQKILALVDYFAAQAPPEDVPVAVFGYGEGGLLALYSGALDERIAGVGVSGYFRNRRELWQEPLYRNVWRLMRGFSDAELAAMVAPRPLTIETTAAPDVIGLPPITDLERVRGRVGAPGKIEPAPLVEVQTEVARARPAYAAHDAADRLVLAEPPAADPGPGSAAALAALLQGLGVEPSGAAGDTVPRDARTGFDPAARQERQFKQIVTHVQQRLELAWRTREDFWSEADTSSLEAWEESAAVYRRRFWEDLIGRCPDPSLPFNAKSRPYGKSDAWDGYEITLDVLPDVFAHGILLVPKGIAPGEQRPVVVCQHGLEGRPEDVIKEEEGPYHAFAARLAERGYITYAPRIPTSATTSFARCSARPIRWAGRSSPLPSRSTSRCLTGSRRCRSSTPSASVSTASRTAARRPCAFPRCSPSTCSRFARATSTSGRASARAPTIFRVTCSTTSGRCRSSTWGRPSTTPRWPTSWRRAPSWSSAATATAWRRTSGAPTSTPASNAATPTSRSPSAPKSTTSTAAT